MLQYEHSGQRALHSLLSMSAVAALKRCQSGHTCCLHYTTFGLSAVCVYEEIAVIKVPTLQGAPQVRCHKAVDCRFD